jgi:hypothetical protein
MPASRLLPAALLLALSVLACKPDATAPVDPKDDDEPPVEDECRPVAPVGRLTQAGPGGPYTYTTSGGGQIVFTEGMSVRITHASYPGFDLDLWGITRNRLSGRHESLSGKHLKDRLGVRRTIVFPDGAKVTMVTTDRYEPLVSVSIYDGSESHVLSPTCGTVRRSSLVQSVAAQLDAAEADGETSTFRFTATGLLLETIYQEDAPGVRVPGVYLLGELFRDSPNEVRDHYDDPRLEHT